MARGGCCMTANMILTVLGCVLYTTAFSSHDWIVGDDIKYGLWTKCNLTFEENCVNSGLSNRDGYFEAFRALFTLALVSVYLCLITCFMDENDSDKGMKRMCYRYVHCFFCVLTVVLAAAALGILRDGYSDDPVNNGMYLGWCFYLTISVTGVLVISLLARVSFICVEHENICEDLCCPCSCQKYQAKTTPGLSTLSLTVSENSLPLTPRSGGSSSIGRASSRLARLPPLPRSFEGRRMIRGNLSSAASDGRKSLLSIPPIGSRSSDSGMDVSRDSTLDDSATSGITGPQPLSVEMLKRHDRRWQRRRGGSGRLRVEEGRHLRPSFSSTTSLSSTDSQSSAELAPRVHTPTNAKRVHYDIPKEPSHPLPPPPSYEEILGQSHDGESAVAPPIISFPTKTHGVELSRAITNARTTATIDNVRMMASAVKRWKSATRRLSKASRGSKGSLVMGSQEVQAAERLAEKVAQKDQDEEKEKKSKGEKEGEVSEPNQRQEKIASLRKQYMGDVRLGEKRAKRVEFSEDLVLGYSERDKEETASRPNKSKGNKNKKKKPADSD